MAHQLETLPFSTGLSATGTAGGYSLDGAGPDGEEESSDAESDAAVAAAAHDSSLFDGSWCYLDHHEDGPFGPATSDAAAVA